MKICYINPAILLRRPVAEIIKKLSQEHEVSLLISKKLFKKRDSSLHHSNFPDNVKIYEYSVVNIPGISSEWPIPIDPRFAYYVFKIFRESDIIHMWAHFYLANFFVSLYKLFMPKKKLVVAIDTFPGYSFSAGKLMDYFFKIYTKTLAKIVYGAPKKIHLYGESLVDYAKQSGINLSKTIIIPTGIDIKKYGEIKDIKKEFNILPDEKVVLYAGLLIQRKGVDIAIKTLAKFKDHKVKLFLVGDGPNRKEYEILAEELGIKNQIIFTGWRRDMQNFYSAADIFLFPSRGEGLAGVIMEAMTFKLPILTSNIPCTPDLIIDNKTGLLCEQDNVDEFSLKLNNLIQDEALRKRLGEEAGRHIENFEWNKVIPKYLDLYRNL